MRGSTSALVAAALMTAAGAAVAAERIGSVVHVTEADNGGSILVPVGLEIRARLAQPSGTRERWELRGDPHVVLISTPESQVSYGTGMGRGREFREFRIRVIRPGRFTLNFGMLPRADSTEPPSQRITMTIDAPSNRGDSWRPNPYDDRQRSNPYDDRQQFNPYDNRTRDYGPDTVEPLTERDAGRQVDVPIGQDMTIALPSNLSTGYHWEAVSTTNVRVLGDIDEQRSRDARIGGGGTSLVRFRVLRPGRADITLMYLPPGGGEPVRTLTYRFRGV